MSELHVFGAIQNLKKTGLLLDLWADAGADGIAFTVPMDMLTEGFFAEARSVRERGLRVLVHPVEFGKSIYTPSDPSLHPFILDKLAYTMDKVRELSLEPLLIVHPPRMAAPDGPICGKNELEEKVALANSLPFYDKLSRISAQSSVSIAIECMHDPYANPGHSMYGYTVDQLRSICDGRDFGICVDTGHSKLSRTSVSEYLNSPLGIIAVHLQGNDGSYDQHKLPNEGNVGDAQGILRMLNLEIPVTLEANPYRSLPKGDDSPREEALKLAADAVSSVKKKRLPSNGS